MNLFLLKDSVSNEYLFYAIIIFAGFLQGIVNTIAGAGTAIMYAVLSFFGMPVNIINGTIRLGVLFQTGASSLHYFRKNKLDIKKGLILSIPLIIGSIVGAEVAVMINKEIFEKIVAVIFIIFVFLMFIDSKKWIEGQSLEKQEKTGFFQILIFFLLGFYGGFIHVGIGIFMLFALVLNAGYDLVKANALKVFLVFTYAPVALLIFLINGQVNLKIAILAAIGNIFGGILGARFSLKKGAEFIRFFVVVVIVFYSFHLLGIWHFIFSL